MNDKLYIHDCDGCVYLDNYQYEGYLSDGERKVYHADLYYCPDKRHPESPSLIARHSDEGSDYSSSEPWAFEGNYAARLMNPVSKLSTHGAAMVECYKRWKDIGNE